MLPIHALITKASGRLFMLGSFQLVNMNLPLREGNTDPMVIKVLLHLPGNVPIDRPVIRGIHPGPANEVDG